MKKSTLPDIGEISKLFSFFVITGIASLRTENNQSKHTYDKKMSNE